MLDFGPYLRFGPICHPLDLVHNTSMAIAGRPGRRASRIHARKAGVLDLLKADAWERRALRWREVDSNLYGAFPVKWCFSVYCQFFVRSGRWPFFIPSLRSGSRSAQLGQGTETLAKLSASA